MTYQRTTLLAIVVATFGCAAVPHPETAREVDRLRVTTDRGPVVGISKEGVREFLGIPFAAAPVGDLRWRPPIAAAAWTAPRDATRRGPACLQPDTGGVTRATSEDCLNLNVWIPRGAGGKRPVLVWIHGGAFVQGSGGDDLYDGAKLAARTGAIVVTFNYRLGALGFLALPELAREAGHAGSPSAGILDQRAAFAWVQRNIAAFGGDPAAVTIFGESAGAWSVCVHLTAPRSRGLFARAIMESGACSNALYASERDAEAQGEALADAVGCTGPSRLACLRDRPAAVLATALPTKRGMILRPGVWWSPVVDGTELPAQPLVSIRAGAFAKVPLVIGANAAEGALHVISFEQVIPTERDDFVREVFGEAAVDDVAATYARATPKEALSDIIGDGIFVCEARRIARAFAQHRVPAYLYHFTRALADPRVHSLGATHSVELFFVWGNTSLGFGLAPEEVPLSNTIMDAWGRFARTGDPGGPALPWPRYAPERDEHLTLDLMPAVGTRLSKQACDFWDELDARPRR